MPATAARTVNVYAHDHTENEFGEPDYAPSDRGYVVPTSSGEGGQGAPYITAFGYAPGLRLSPESTPDPYRQGTEPLRQARPTGRDPLSTDPFYVSSDADDAKRHSVEWQDADGAAETKEFPGFPSASAGANRFARNPREVPPPESRPTMQLMPRNYFFTRPFMQGLAKNGARALNGLHFSMADHRRKYEASEYGMEPVRTRRNTFRLEPSPWDNGQTDMPPIPAAGGYPQNQEAQPQVEVSYGSRSNRLM